MFAILEIAGKQFKVVENQEYFTPKLNFEKEQIVLEKVLVIDKGDGNVSIGQPYIDNAKVEAKIVASEVKGDKVIVFKKKRRKGYKKTQGHRQKYSKILIQKITN